MWSPKGEHWGKSMIMNGFYFSEGMHLDSYDMNGGLIWCVLHI